MMLTAVFVLAIAATFAVLAASTYHKRNQQHFTRRAVPIPVRSRTSSRRRV